MWTTGNEPTRCSRAGGGREDSARETAPGQERRRKRALLGAQDTFTTVGRTTGADVVGPILCGFATPLSPMPRDARLDDLGAIGVTALQATWR